MAYKPGDPGDFNSLSDAAKDFIRKAGPTTQELKEIMEPTKFELDVWQTYDELAELLLKKHRDYGPKNISESPGGPLNGLRVRMHDKLARINHLYDSGATPENESLRDSFIDMANYSIIALMVLDGDWDNRSMGAVPDLKEIIDWA